MYCIAQSSNALLQCTCPATQKPPRLQHDTDDSHGIKMMISHSCATALASAWCTGRSCRSDLRTAVDQGSRSALSSPSFSREQGSRVISLVTHSLKAIQEGNAGERTISLCGRQNCGWCERQCSVCSCCNTCLFLSVPSPRMSMALILCTRMHSNWRTQHALGAAGPASLAQQPLSLTTACSSSRLLSRMHAPRYSSSATTRSSSISSPLRQSWTLHSKQPARTRSIPGPPAAAAPAATELSAAGDDRAARLAAPVVIIGGGPVGLCTALMLARRGYTQIKVGAAPSLALPKPVCVCYCLHDQIMHVFIMTSCLHA